MVRLNCWIITGEKKKKLEKEKTNLIYAQHPDSHDGGIGDASLWVLDSTGERPQGPAVVFGYLAVIMGHIEAAGQVRPGPEMGCKDKRVLGRSDAAVDLGEECH